MRDVVGVDLSTKNMAYTRMVYDDESAEYFGQGYCWVSTASFSLGTDTYSPQTCLNAYNLANEILSDEFTELVVYLESPIVHSKFAQAVLPLGGVSGAFQAGCVGRGFEVRMVPAPSWKKTLCGNGHATKEDVKRAVEGKFPDVARHVQNSKFVQDCYDSYGVAVYGCEAEHDRQET